MGFNAVFKIQYICSDLRIDSATVDKARFGKVAVY